MTGRPTDLVSQRVRHVASKGWLIGQAAGAAGVAYWVAHDILGHEDPFVAPLATVVSLGTSYGQRLRRVVEVTLGICLGLVLASLLVHVVGGGVWQLTIVVALAIGSALLLGGGPLLVSQAAVQAIVFVSVLPASVEVPMRCVEAAVGGGVAIAAATLLPRAALRSPLDQVAAAADTIAQLLRGSAHGILHPDVDATMRLLTDARSTDPVLADLRCAADEGLAAVRTSLFHRSERSSARQVAELVEPLDLALRNTRVLVRRVTVAAVRGEPLPRHCAIHCTELASLVDRLTQWLREPGTADPQAGLVSFAHALVPPAGAGQPEIVATAQLRSVVADLLRLTGMTGLESTQALGTPLVGRTSCHDVQ